MIPRSAVVKFLNRPLSSHLWMKGLTEKQVDAAINILLPKPTLNSKLRLHQRVCFLLGVSFPQFCFWLSMGTGKTVLAYELLRYWWQCGQIRRAIIFVTSDKAFNTWEKQLKRFKINLPLMALEGSSEQKWKQLEEFDEGLVLIPYPGALFMVSSKVRAKKGKKKLKLDPKKLKRLEAWAQAIVMDESTKSAGDSLTFAMVAALRKNAKIRYALAGRPFGRDPIMLWAQHFLIDGGETLGETKGIFRAAFYSDKPSYWGGPYSKEYAFKKNLEPKLARLIQHRSITYSADECIDLPKVVPILEVVRFPEEAGAYYQRVVKQVIAARGNLREMKSAFIRMRQISSGFVGFKNDETGERAEIEFQENPKLDRLLELIEEVPDGLGSVVYYEFTHSGRRIVQELKALGYKPIWLWSGTKDARKELDSFAKSERPVAVLQNRIGSMSIDGLQRTASYDFEFESPLSVIDFDQARKRLVRDGQLHTVFQYSLEVEGTVDSKIREYHLGGEALFKALLRNPEKSLGLL